MTISNSLLSSRTLLLVRQRIPNIFFTSKNKKIIFETDDVSLRFQLTWQKRLVESFRVNPTKKSTKKNVFIILNTKNISKYTTQYATTSHLDFSKPDLIDQQKFLKSFFPSKTHCNGLRRIFIIFSLNTNNQYDTVPIYQIKRFDGNLQHLSVLLFFIAL